MRKTLNLVVCTFDWICVNLICTLLNTFDYILDIHDMIHTLWLLVNILDKIIFWAYLDKFMYLSKTCVRYATYVIKLLLVKLMHTMIETNLIYLCWELVYMPILCAYIICLLDIYDPIWYMEYWLIVVS